MRGLASAGWAFCLLLLAATAQAAPATQSSAFVVPAFAKALQGCWRQDGNGGTSLRFDGQRLLFAADGRFKAAAGIVRYEPNRIVVRLYGQKDVRPWAIKGGRLVIRHSDRGTQRYQRLANVPPELELAPLPLGEAKPLEADKVAGIQKELARRLEADQAVRRDAARAKEMAKVDAENTAYVRKVLGELGWIDAGRFGAEASQAAFLLVQHSGDLPLMLAALAPIEQDVKAKRLRDAQPYALLFDRTRLLLGEKQRYGTQIGSDAKGNPVVLPLEDRQKVEEFRKEIGLFPLSKYMAAFGKEVKFMDDGDE